MSANNKTPVLNLATERVSVRPNLSKAERAMNTIFQSRKAVIC
jgi:hypothetical protein